MKNTKIILTTNDGSNISKSFIVNNTQLKGIFSLEKLGGIQHFMISIYDDNLNEMATKSSKIYSDFFAHVFQNRKLVISEIVKGKILR